MIEKFIEWLDRAKSRVYGIYAFWIAIGFSPIIFVALFVDQELIYSEKRLLKNEYVKQEYLNLETWQGWVYLIGVPLMAAGLTFLTVWKFPGWFVNRSYEKETDDQMKRDFYQISKKDELDKKRKALVDKQMTTVQKEELVVEKQEELESKEKRSWQKDYNEFSNTTLFNQFYLIPESIYEHYGRISETDSLGGVTFEIPTELLAYADGNGLIKVDTQDRSIDLTDKGRFFLKNSQLNA